MNKLNILSATVRVVLTIGLVIMVYKETGLFTALSIGLIFVTIEMLGVFIKLLIKTIK